MVREEHLEERGERGGGGKRLEGRTLVQIQHPMEAPDSGMKDGSV